MIFLNSHELFSYLNKVIDDKLLEKDVEDIKIRISTFGISLYQKRSEIGKEVFYEDTPAINFIEKLDGTDARILVGVACEKNHGRHLSKIDKAYNVEKLDKIFRIGDKYNITCIPVEGVHFKLYRIDDIYITGGINFGDSNWNDCAVLIEDETDKERLDFLFNCSWQRATSSNPIDERCRQYK